MLPHRLVDAGYNAMATDIVINKAVYIFGYHPVQRILAGHGAFLSIN
jgi:hypothetical protein